MKIVTSLACALVFFISAAHAAAPGANGRIAYQNAGALGTAIAVVDNDGAGLRVLTSGASATAPAWKPASPSIAFVSAGKLSAVDLVSGNVTALLAADGYALSAPAWSPDGAKLAFIGTKTADGSTDLWVANADGTGLTNLTNDAAKDADPAWSPDGAKILFATDRDGNFEIYSILPDGTGAARLTDDPSADRDPDMSPDGSKIVFVRTESDLMPALWTMNADGSNGAALTDGSFAAVTPAWSPDGSLIAFAGAPEADFDIWTIAPNGDGQTFVTGGSGDQTSPSWQTIAAGDNRPPTAGAGAGATIECTSPAGAAAHLDGMTSTDPDSTAEVNDIVLYEWFENFGIDGEKFLGTGSTLDATLSLGEHEITLQVTDSVGQTATATITVIVEDTTPPVIHVTVTPEFIWPPNHKMVAVHATVRAIDACSPQVTVKLVSVTSSEPDNSTGDGNTSNDIQNASIGTADYNFLVRAERKGNGNGRIYTATYSATDASANTATASADIKVSHDQGNGNGNAGGNGNGDPKSGGGKKAPPKNGKQQKR
jgi:dipeptidyl aminopeptidase/acylaminoacyl peptidase